MILAVGRGPLAFNSIKDYLVLLIGVITGFDKKLLSIPSRIIHLKMIIERIRRETAFNSIKDYQYREFVLLLMQKHFFQFHQGLSCCWDSWFRERRRYIDTFNSIKDYQTAIRPATAPPLAPLSIPSRII